MKSPIVFLGILAGCVACSELTAPPSVEVAPEPANQPATTAKAAARQPNRNVQQAGTKRRPSEANRPADDKKIGAAHILIGFDGTPGSKSKRSKGEAMKLAQQLAARAKKGEDFAALAKKYSEGPSGPKGGDLGQFGKKQMVKPFADAAFALKPGQVSDVVLTRFGYHVIKRTQ